MLKNSVEKIAVELETVEDMIRALMKMPAKYRLHPLGQKCEMGVDHTHECVYLDESTWLDTYIDEAKEEAEESGEPFEIDVPDENLNVFQQELFVVMGYSDICMNGNYEAQLQGVFSTEELAKECGDELVKCGNIHHYEIECPLLDEFGWK